MLSVASFNVQLAKIKYMQLNLGFIKNQKIYAYNWNESERSPMNAKGRENKHTISFMKLKVDFFYFFSPAFAVCMCLEHLKWLIVT